VEGKGLARKMKSRRHKNPVDEVRCLERFCSLEAEVLTAFPFPHSLNLLS
jgi:hypothetical protein